MKFIKEHKYWLIVGVVLLAFSIAIHVLKVAEFSSYTLWYKRLATQIYRYFRDWGVIFSALGTLLLAAIAFWTIRQGRRSKGANELNTWARDSVKLILISMDKDTTSTQQLNLLQNRLRTVSSEAVTLISSASKYSKAMVEKVNNILEECNSVAPLESTMENENEVIQKLGDALSTIGNNLVEIIHETS